MNERDRIVEEACEVRGIDIVTARRAVDATARRCAEIAGPCTCDSIARKLDWKCPSCRILRAFEVEP